MDEQPPPNIQFGDGYGGTSLYTRDIGQQQNGLLADSGAVIYIDGGTARASLAIALTQR